MIRRAAAGTAVAVVLWATSGWLMTLSSIAPPSPAGQSCGGDEFGPKRLSEPTSRPAGGSTAAPTTAPATREQVAAKVTETVANLLGKKDADRNQIKPSATWEDLGADDLEQALIILDCEQLFGVTVPDDQSEKINTVGQLIDFILTHKAAAAPADKPSARP